jgi:hypothetical protein
MLAPIAAAPQRQKFWPREDDRLRYLVGQLGTSSWERIASEMPGRTARQCRERWKHYLSTSRPTSEWSPDEDELLCVKMQQLGPRWTQIAQSFPGRSDVQVKARWMHKFAGSSDLHIGRARRRKLETLAEEEQQPPQEQPKAPAPPPAESIESQRRRPIVRRIVVAPK